MSLRPGKAATILLSQVTYTERSPEQADLLRERSKRFLALHLIFGIFVLGISLVFLWLLLNFSQLFTPLAETTVLPRYCCTIPLTDKVKEDTDGGWLLLLPL